MQRLIRSRTGCLAIVLLVAMAAFVLRLFQLQILQYSKYTEMARASQQRQFIIPAERGKIYMIDGKTPAPVVLNQAVYTVIADPHAVNDKEREQIITSLREVAGGEMTDKAAVHFGAIQRVRWERTCLDLLMRRARVSME